MVCKHLIKLEKALLEKGFKVTFRGQAWSQNCREWVYFDCYLERSAIRKVFSFAPCVADHEHLGTHDGQEAGFFCQIHYDAIMGIHPKSSAKSHVPVYSGE
jgi:hypothetical protein